MATPSSVVLPTDVQQALDNIWGRLRALEGKNAIPWTSTHGLTLALIQDTP